MDSVFNDKASLVLRKMLEYPTKSWVAKDFIEDTNIGYAWAARVLSQLRNKGYLKGVARGRNASSTLRNAKELVQAWTQYYTFERNRTFAYYSPDENIPSKTKRFFNEAKYKEGYALTLHSGANLVTNHVRQENAYFYLDPNRFDEISLELRKALDLKELKKGGNVYFIQPYYKNSVFFGAQKIGGYRVVSNLQLYLDLYHFPQRGREHAEYLLRTLKEEGKNLGG
ncbi:MAG: hypothetical protein A2W61_06965 [Deltaproteobacteria bacterium RIFCSPLOWO2_01_44_7]|nr:MAG: hypothetical protein A2712_11150 [Deltaproteobacteria bacterium RIFCSPHIGHO2_01_FULL_43_49]OGQ16604.1 MAG: hypothetical protein A3D22_06850 [Deltaproteobacteria bacterium RIFCSPHIGHO2_02_FULL_44_53]OGQ28419.1 MAG: hypothetical protein A3D98_06555 [Deltaproteobacteria bacterium RIFCSPHIGHO2_12_FULL_44_21]OGQ32491.1 MAG: hypothetical protein A2979_11115 [Deltaproteobacteria bacterium RIFCSPLOWO2_01_FULL_45_74]OGQ39161.1 MAG: hypothetical protein A2W61_06965 [Deltaproteobacteria bacterium 